MCIHVHIYSYTCMCLSVYGYIALAAVAVEMWNSLYFWNVSWKISLDEQLGRAKHLAQLKKSTKKEYFAKVEAVSLFPQSPMGLWER